MHVLGAPPAFVLSQDQTLSFILVTARTDQLATVVPCRTPAPSPACPRCGPASRAGRRRRRPRSPKESKPPPPTPSSKADRSPRARPARRPRAPRTHATTPARPKDPPFQRCLDQRPQPPPTHPFPRSTLPKNNRSGDHGVACRAGGRGFIVIAGGRHKSFFGRFLLVNASNYKFVPRVSFS